MFLVWYSQCIPVTQFQLSFETWQLQAHVPHSMPLFLTHRQPKSSQYSYFGWIMKRNTSKAHALFLENTQSLLSCQYKSVQPWVKMNEGFLLTKCGRAKILSEKDVKGKINIIKLIIKLTFQVLWLMLAISVFKLTIYSNGFFVFCAFSSYRNKPWLFDGGLQWSLFSYNLWSSKEKVINYVKQFC